MAEIAVFSEASSQLATEAVSPRVKRPRRESKCSLLCNATLFLHFPVCLHSLWHNESAPCKAADRLAPVRAILYLGTRWKGLINFRSCHFTSGEITPFSEGGLGILEKRKKYVAAAGFVTRDIQPLAYSLHRRRCPGTCLCMVQSWEYKKGRKWCGQTSKFTRTRRICRK